MQQNMVKMENERLNSTRRLIEVDLRKAMLQIAEQDEIIRELSEALENQDTCHICHSSMASLTFAELIQDELQETESQRKEVFDMQLEIENCFLLTDFSRMND